MRFSLSFQNIQRLHLPVIPSVWTTHISPATGHACGDQWLALAQDMCASGKHHFQTEALNTRVFFLHLLSLCHLASSAPGEAALSAGHGVTTAWKLTCGRSVMTSEHHKEHTFVFTGQKTPKTKPPPKITIYIAPA